MKPPSYSRINTVIFRTVQIYSEECNGSTDDGVMETRVSELKFNVPITTRSYKMDLDFVVVLDMLEWKNTIL